MSTGHSVLDALAAHFVVIRTHHQPTKREVLLMATADKLGQAIKLLLTSNDSKDKEIADKDKEISDLKAAAAATAAAPATGVTEAEAEDMISQIEAKIGPVSDPTASTGSVAGLTANAA